MNLEEAQSQLTLALSSHKEVPLFELLSESQWGQECEVSKDHHRRIMSNEGGVVCLDCQKVVALDKVLVTADPDDLKLWASTIVNYWNNRKASIKRP